jgi:ABC-type multidrug transport system fused ATPase/permease subunit
MIADTAVIQEGISEKIGLMIQFFCTFVSGFVIAFVKGWKLALVLCSVFPLLAGAAVFMSWALSGGSSESSDAYASAGNIAQQVISAMKTVSAFGGEDREADGYEKQLYLAEKAGIKGAFVNGVGVGCIQFLIFSVYALAFWYGNTLVPVEMNAGQVLNVFFAIIIGAFSLGQATPYLAVIGTAQGAAYKVFDTLDRVSPIDPSSEKGEKPEKVSGNITFKNIDFHYPTRTDVPILINFNLEVKAGQTVALVGSSGSGKSTIVKLLERFYNPVKGTVTLDSRDVSTLNVTWLRRKIGVVSQEVGYLLIFFIRIIYFEVKKN